MNVATANRFRRFHTDETVRAKMLAASAANRKSLRPLLASLRSLPPASSIEAQKAISARLEATLVADLPDAALSYLPKALLRKACKERHVVYSRSRHVYHGVEVPPDEIEQVAPPARAKRSSLPPEAHAILVAMPPLSHWPKKPEPWRAEDSEVLQWIAQNVGHLIPQSDPDSLNRSFYKFRVFLQYDATSGKWSGKQYEAI